MVFLKPFACMMLTYEPSCSSPWSVFTSCRDSCADVLPGFRNGATGVRGVVPVRDLRGAGAVRHPGGLRSGAYAHFSSARAMLPRKETRLHRCSVVIDLGCTWYGSSCRRSCRGRLWLARVGWRALGSLTCAVCGGAAVEAEFLLPAEEAGPRSGGGAGDGDSEAVRRPAVGRESDERDEGRDSSRDRRRWARFLRAAEKGRQRDSGVQSIQAGKERKKACEVGGDEGMGCE